MPVACRWKLIHEGQIPARCHLFLTMLANRLRLQILRSSFSLQTILPFTNGQGSTPSFAQSSYNFPINSCASGTYVGQVSANGASPITYSVDNSFVISVDKQTGSLFLGGTIASGLTFNVIAGNQFGSVQVPVTVTANCGTTGTTINRYQNNNLATSYYGGIPTNYYGNNIGSYPYNYPNNLNNAVVVVSTNGNNGYNYGNSNIYTNGIGTCYGNKCYYGGNTNSNTNQVCYNGICYNLNNSNTNSNQVCYNGVCYNTNNGNTNINTNQACYNGVCYIYTTNNNNNNNNVICYNGACTSTGRWDKMPVFWFMNSVAYNYCLAFIKLVLDKKKGHLKTSVLFGLPYLHIRHVENNRTSLSWIPGVFESVTSGYALCDMIIFTTSQPMKSCCSK